jgi:hypothetical protein
MDDIVEPIDEPMPRYENGWQCPCGAWMADDADICDYCEE